MLRELVFDALYDRRSRTGSHCFVVNEAGMELFRENATILPLIEDVLQDIVEGELVKEPAAQDITDVFTQGDAFPGLDYLLGAYLVLGGKYDPDRVIQFLESRSDELKQRAIATIPVFFDKDETGYRFTIGPTQQLRDFVEKETHSNNVRLRQMATRVFHSL